MHPAAISPLDSPATAPAPIPNPVAPISFITAIPQLPVSDVETTQQFYRKIFGFRTGWLAEDTDSGSVSRDDTLLHFFRAPGPIQPQQLTLLVRDVDAIHREWRTAGAKLLGEPQSTTRLTREFVASDNNGHRIRIAQRVRPPRAAALSPLERVRIVRRLPTTAEYLALCREVQEPQQTTFECAARSLARSLFSVVAELEGRCIGLARVCGDGAIVFQIMDVAVLPAYRLRGVGTRLMNSVIEFLAFSATPSARIGIFTDEAYSAFFERFGLSQRPSRLHGLTAKELKPIV